MVTPHFKYNPSRTPEDELTRTFVVRRHDLAAILETVRDNTGASNQHLLVLGPRGAGKTTLVHRAVAEIRRTPTLNALWYPILFDEESYTVTSAGELWFQALSHLADQTRDPALDQARRALRTVTDRTRLRDAAMARILEFADTRHSRLLLVFENIDMIFDAQMPDDDGWDVRHTLQNEPKIMVLATAPHRLAAFHDCKRPLYELFHEYTLDPLDAAECRAVWRMVTGADLPPDHARAIQIFTGGNTRLVTTLAGSAGHRSSRERIDDLLHLVDENTAYFKHKIEALPPESRKIFVTLADLWSPATSRQVAEQTRGDIRAVSAQLGRLEQQGLVEVVGRVDRTQLFQVAERMANLYYLLRRQGPHPARAALEFIVHYYDDIRAHLATLVHEARTAAADSIADPVWAYCEKLLLARKLALGSDWRELWAPLALVLADADFVRDHLRDIVALAALAAAHGHHAAAAHTLAASPNAAHLEPLVVALRRLSGEPTNPPHEVREVADDIVRDIERLRDALAHPPDSPTTGPTHKQHRQTRKRSRHVGSHG